MRERKQWQERERQLSDFVVQSLEPLTFSTYAVNLLQHGDPRPVEQ
jgi:hypothetical protein